MPRVLTTNATITCPHSGSGTSTASIDKWSVNGGTVLLENDTGTLACPSNYPCIGYQLKSMGLNATTVDGRKVILVTDLQLSQTGLPLKISESHSTHDDSTPAPNPAGQPTPPLAPEMVDLVEPTVVAVPPGGAFTTSTMMPATLPVAFTLFSQNPSQWMLTLINETVGTHADATNGLPGLIVTPPGGSWSSPTLVVTAMMTAAFMAALSPGKHHLFMAGVSKRGLFGLWDFQLQVSA